MSSKNNYLWFILTALPKIAIERTRTSQGVPVSKHSQKGNVAELSPTAGVSSNGDTAFPNGAGHNIAFQQYTPVLGNNKRKRDPQSKLPDEAPKMTPAVSTLQSTSASKIDAKKSAEEEQDRELKRVIRKEKKRKEREEHNSQLEESKDDEDGQAESDIVNLDMKSKKKKRKERVSDFEGEDIVRHFPGDLAHDVEALRSAEKKKRRRKKDAPFTAETEGNDNQSENGSVSEGQLPRKGTNLRSKVDADTKGGVEPLDDGVFGSNGQSADQSEQQRQKSDVTNDNEWLRAKTSRVLDLVESEPEAKIPEPPISSERIDEPIANPQDEEEEELSTLGAPGPAPSQESDPSSAERLFVRNLPYSANETEIENLFSKFGQLKEVRFPQNHILFHFHDEHLIGTAYA